MIVYLFWHWAERPEGYEEGLVDFHGRLATAGVPGLVANATYRVSGLPWLGAGPGYEDWYAVGGFADLEPLNRMAVEPPLRALHDRPALAAAGGTGSLYALQSGVLGLEAESVTWLAKPAGTAYPDFFESLPATSSLFRRQLALGPAPEFCAAGELRGGIVSRRTRLF